MDRRRAPAKLRDWFGRRKLELAVLSFGVLLRASFAWTNEVSWAFDQADHWQVAVWIAKHGRLPAVDTLRESFHPPLFYVLGAVLLKLGLHLPQMIALPILCGTFRLGLLWAAFERYLESSRSARLAALALAAVLPASVHVDGIVHPEPLNGLWTALAMYLGAAAFQNLGRQRWRLALAAGLVLGVGMLTKISASVIVASLLCAAALEFALAERDLRSKLHALLPWAGMLALCSAVCGWYFARNLRDHQQLFLTSFDLRFEQGFVARSNKLPYLDRRSLGYVLGWNPHIFVYPFHPTAISPHPQFFPVAVASSFTDYWNFCFSGLPPAERFGPSLIFDRIVRASQFAVMGGTVICVATVGAWFPAMRRALMTRQFAQVSLLIVPVLTLASALHFAIAYPVDDYGVVKGIYMQFGAPPMYALFGLSVDWTRRRPDRWPLFWLLMLALWCVLSYTVFCRLRVPLLPLS